MSRRIKKMNFWVRRRSHLALLVIGSVVVLLLFFNEDASMRLNMQYQEKIRQLSLEIRECEDSAAWYKARREALFIGTDELEHVVREEYHMQKPGEDVFIIKESGQ